MDGAQFSFDDAVWGTEPSDYSTREVWSIMEPGDYFRFSDTPAIRKPMYKLDDEYYRDTLDGRTWPISGHFGAESTYGIVLMDKPW